MGDYGHDLEFGVFVEPAAHSADQVVALSVRAEEAGYDLVTFTDHPYSPRNLDALTLMAFVAARTSRVRLAANVLNLPLRPPAVLARAVREPGHSEPRTRRARHRRGHRLGRDRGDGRSAPRTGRQCGGPRGRHPRDPRAVERRRAGR